MSTQGDAGTPISLLAEEQHQHFRLLELPPELLEILTSANPPTLYFKSAEVAPGESAGNAVLCTHDKTYNIRQKNSSNTVYVLQPHESNDESGKQRIQIISQPQSTLETTPAPKPCAAPYIRQLLPVLSSTGQPVGARDSLTKAQLFAHIPASDAECELAFRDLAVLVDEYGKCMIPSAQLRLDTWHSILAAARARSIDLTASLTSNSVDLLRTDVSDVNDLQGTLVSAIVRSVLIQYDGGIATQDVRIDPSALVRWVGITRLEAMSAKTSTAVSMFKSAWKDDMPELWRSKVDLTLLAGRYTLSDGGMTIHFRDYQLDLEDDVSASTAPDGKAAAGSKRKQWHEKFRPSKRPT
ncbi:hypothetical protein B0A48_04890 [Cryoendolithus antarcticus]|uniref:Sister chromatid cohesion protein Dcc1 n=1 Tax=Cryoendolithus antarcticus TaxID=1507870 RepID=A0A1V8TDN4_9PEZI|nr:hypothetical protein B0A48_04890 [Cryoendolithus antarcticus]